MFKYTALIIEPREHKALNFVINNFLSCLSDEWGMIIFHGKKNHEYVENIVNNLEENYKNRIIKLIKLNVDNLTHTTYSDLFFSTQFYDYIPTNTFLVFQTDSMILKENKNNINLFLEYDYVGAPWLSNLVGNGGLSLRKKDKMLEILESKKDKNKNMFEDMFFSFDIDCKIMYNVPNYEKARMFSVETTFYENPFGIHNCWKSLSKNNTDFLRNKYPELKKLMELQD
jgi:hypothetical protein